MLEGVFFFFFKIYSLSLQHEAKFDKQNATIIVVRRFVEETVVRLNILKICERMVSCITKEPPKKFLLQIMMRDCPFLTHSSIHARISRAMLG